MLFRSTYDGGSKYNGNVIGTRDVSTSYTYQNLNKKDSNYYTGYYMGNVYYRGTTTAPQYSNDEDVRVESRTDQYIDYVDNDLVFKTEDNVNTNGTITYLTYSAQEIASKGLMAGVDNTTTIISDGMQNYYDITSNTNNNLGFNIEDATINGMLYKYLPAKRKSVINLNEADVEIGGQRGVDLNGDGKISSTIRSIGNPYSGNETTYNGQLNNDLYFIDIQASRTLTSEVDLNGINIDNLAEIIKVSNTVGRKVYVSTSKQASGYIGNTKPQVEEIRKVPVSIVTVGSRETDTDFTEFVTFSPPTGLSQSDIKVSDTMNKVIDYTIIGISSIVIIVGSVYVIIQFIKRKKFYK